MNQSVPVLFASGVAKSFPGPRGPVTVLKKVNLEISLGEFVMITGPSGSGKTTFLNLAALLDSPTGGELTFDGEAVGGLSENELCSIRKHKVGMVFQRFCLLPHRTARENVLFRFRYVDNDRADQERRAGEALAEMQLSDVADRPARLLSSGEMQRTAIARAVVLQPCLLLADEPTGNLDLESSEAVMRCFSRLNKNGMTILMATHDESLLGHCTRRVRCEDGVIEGNASRAW